MDIKERELNEIIKQIEVIEKSISDLKQKLELFSIIFKETSNEEKPKNKDASQLLLELLQEDGVIIKK